MPPANSECGWTAYRNCRRGPAATVGRDCALPQRKGVGQVSVRLWAARAARTFGPRGLFLQAVLGLADCLRGQWAEDEETEDAHAPDARGSNISSIHHKEHHSWLPKTKTSIAIPSPMSPARIPSARASAHWAVPSRAPVSVRSVGR